MTFLGFFNRPNGLGAYPQQVTVGDVQTLITAKFIYGTCEGIGVCVAEGDVNQSGGTSPTCAVFRTRVSVSRIRVRIESPVCRDSWVVFN